MNQITNDYVRWYVENNIKKVFIGKVEGIERRTHKNKRVGRKTAQKLSQWQFGAIQHKLKYKLERVGIEVEFITEAHTTQTCPLCGRKHKPQGRNYVCICGYREHRDYHGANGILSLGLYGEIRFLHKYEGTYRQPSLVRRRRTEPSQLRSCA